jgi:hypothetical protein
LQTKEEMLEFLRFIENECSTANMSFIKMRHVRVRDEDEDIMRKVINKVTQPYFPVTNTRVEPVDNYDDI